MPAPTTTGHGDNGTQAAASNSAQLRGIPSFKLMDDERGSKRLRNRVPSYDRAEGEGEMSIFMSMCEDAVATEGRVCPRRLSSFSLASEVVHSMARASSWGSGAGGSFFPFGPPSADGYGDDVQRLDDAAFADLNFFTMEDVGPSGKPLTQNEGRTGPETTANDRHAAGRIDKRAKGGGARGGSGNAHVTVPKEVITMVTSAGRTGSAGDVLGGSVFDPNAKGPSFSASMEDYLNRQLEAAEQFLHGKNDSERAFRNATGSSGSGSGVCSTSVHVARRAGISPVLHPASSAVAKSDHNIHTGSGGTLHGAMRSLTGQGQKERLKPSKVEAESECGVGKSQQYDSEEQTESSDSEHKTAPQREDKTKKRRRGRGAASVRATKKSGGDRVRAGNRSSDVVPVGKRQTSEDVAARLPLEVLECFYHVPLNVAANELNVSLTMLKKLCRAYGVKRWPHRQVSSLDKTLSRLEEKINARMDGGKDAPSLVRKLTQARKRRGVIIKTASAGLEADVLNAIFNCRPGDIDEDLLLKSTDVAKTLEQMKPLQRVGLKDTDSEDDDEEDNSTNGRSYMLEKSSSSASRKLSVRATTTPLLRTAKPSSLANLTGSMHPPAFEPGTKSGLKKFNGKPGVKTGANEELPTPARRYKKEAAASIKGRKGVTAAAVTSSAGAAASISRKAAVAAAAAAVFPQGQGSFAFDGSSDGSVASVAGESLSRCSSPVFPFGSSPGARPPMTGYSGVFGMGLHPPSAAGGGNGSTTSSAKRTGSESSGRTSSVQARTAVAAHVQSAQMSGWRAAMEKRAVNFAEWCGATSSPQSSASPLHLSDATPDSPTMIATVNNFDSKLRVESPPPGPLLSSPVPPPPPPHGHHTYLQQQFQHPHQPHSSLHNLNWVQGQYPGQQPFVFSADAAPPINTRNAANQGGTRGFHAFSRANSSDDAKEDDLATIGSTGGGVCSSLGGDGGGGGGGDGNGGGGGAAVGGAAAIGVPATTKSGDVAAMEQPITSTTDGAAPTRTGFMSFLLHQSPDIALSAGSPPAVDT